MQRKPIDCPGSSSNSRPWRKKVHLTTHWQNIFLTLVLALSIGSPSHSAAAQAAAPAKVYFFHLQVLKPKTLLCTGEKVFYLASVFGVPASNGKDPVANPPLDKLTLNGGYVKAALDYPINVPGVKIEAYAADPSIGVFTNTNKAGGASQVSGVFRFENYNVKFEFTAGKKPGSSRLFFEGAVKGYDIHTGYISDTIPVKVIECKYKVNAITRFPANAIDNPMIPYPPITVRMDKTVITRDTATGGDFNGTANLKWFNPPWNQSSAGPHCTVVQKFDSTNQVNIDAAVILAGKLEVYFEYQEVSSAVTETCDGVDQPGSTSYLLNPLHISVPISGGKVTTAHGLATGFMGSTVVVVIPEKIK